MPTEHKVLRWWVKRLGIGRVEVWRSYPKFTDTGGVPWSARYRWGAVTCDTVWYYAENDPTKRIGMRAREWEHGNLNDLPRFMAFIDRRVKR